MWCIINVIQLTTVLYLLPLFNNSKPLWEVITFTYFCQIKVKTEVNYV